MGFLTRNEHLVLGTVLDLKTGKNVTQWETAKLNRLNESDLKRLEKIVAFEVGSPKAPYLYLIVDPECPYCKRLEREAEDLVKEEKVRFKVIFYPLPIHPQAKPEAEALSCIRDPQKAWGDLLSGSFPKKSCPEGKERVRVSLETLISLGVRGTPTIVTPSGLVFSGYRDKRAIIGLAQEN